MELKTIQPALNFMVLALNHVVDHRRSHPHLDSLRRQPHAAQIAVFERLGFIIDLFLLRDVLDRVFVWEATYEASPLLLVPRALFNPVVLQLSFENNYPDADSSVKHYPERMSRKT